MWFMKKRRWWLWLAGVVFIIGGGFLVLLHFSLRKQSAQECYERIKVGMSEEEADKILKENGFRHISESHLFTHTPHIAYRRERGGNVICLTFRYPEATVSNMVLKPKEPFYYCLCDWINRLYDWITRR